MTASSKLSEPREELPAGRGTLVKFNLNHNVWVQLTDVGRAVLRAAHAELYKISAIALPCHFPKEEGSGWSRWQLWNLMNQLGSACHNGFDNPLLSEVLIEFEPAIGVSVTHGVEASDAELVELAQRLQARSEEALLEGNHVRAKDYLDAMDAIAGLQRRLAQSNELKPVRG